MAWAARAWGEQSVLETVAGPDGADDVGVVQPPVQDGGGEHLSSRALAPPSERLIAVRMIEPDSSCRESSWQTFLGASPV